MDAAVAQGDNDNDEADAEEVLETPRVLEEVAIRNDFWSPMRSSVWQKREIAEPSIEPPTSPSFRSSRASSPEHVRTQIGRLPALQKTPPFRQRKTMQGFSLHPADVKRTKRISGNNENLLSLEEAVEVAKEIGGWPQKKPQSPNQKSLDSTDMRLSKSQSTPNLRHLPRIESPAPKQELVYGTLDLTNPLNPLSVFPDLALRQKLPARRLCFDGPDHGSDTCVVSKFSPETPRFDNPGLTTLDPLVAALYAEQNPPTPRLLERHPRERHPPSWLASKGTKDQLSDNSIYKIMGPCSQVRVETDTASMRTKPANVWAASCAENQVPPRAPRSILRAFNEAVLAEAPTSPEASQTSAGNQSPDNALPPCQVDLGRQGLHDAALLALSESLPLMGPLQALSLAGGNLSGGAIANFIDIALRNHGKALKELDLSCNRHLSGTALQALAHALEFDMLNMLENVNISGVAVPSKSWEPFLRGIRAQGRVNVLSLANTQLGYWRQLPGAADLGALVADGQLQSLDVSGNYLMRETCMVLSRALAVTPSLHVLDVSHSAGDSFATTTRPPALPLPEAKAVDGGDSQPSSPGKSRQATTTAVSVHEPAFAPLLILCEGVLRNRTLKRISLAGCSLEYAADFMLGEAFAKHPTLERVDLSGNPHGAAGIACLLRAYASPTSKLSQMPVRDLRAMVVVHPTVWYRFEDPSGHYDLKLQHPQHRSVLRAMLSRLEAGKKMSECVSELRLHDTPAGFSLDSCMTKDVDGVFVVPKEGRVNFKYTAAVTGTPTGAGPYLDGRFSLSLKRCAMLITEVYSSCFTVAQRKVFFKGVAEAYRLKCKHILLFSRTSPVEMSGEIVSTLLPSVVGSIGPAASPETKERSKRMKEEMIDFSMVNALNPTGRYSFDLWMVPDRACARLLQTLAAFEAEVLSRQVQGKTSIDISQKGDFEPVRNLGCEELTSEDLQCKFSELSLPSACSLKFDYASLVPPPNVQDATSRELVKAIFDTVRLVGELPGSNIMRAFKTIVHHLALSVDDVKRFMALGDPLEVFLMLWPRCYQRSELVGPAVLYNEDLMDLEEAGHLRDRLGICQVLDWQRVGLENTNWPSGKQFDLDLAFNDNRQVVKFLLSIALAESDNGTGSDRLVDCRWSEETEEEGLKDDWINAWIQDTPSKGTISLSYEVKRGSNPINVENRKPIAERYLGI